MAKRTRSRNDDIEKAVPAFMRGDLDQGLGTEAISSASLPWVGRDGTFDAEEMLLRHGYDDQSPLELLVRAIVAGHPTQPEQIDLRVESALEALTGQAPRAGPKPKNDTLVLLEIGARRHHALMNRTRQSLWSIIDDLIDERGAPSREQSRESYHRRLQRKFDKHEDLICSRATHQQDADRMLLSDKLHKILDQLREIGIESDSSVLPTRMSFMDKTSTS